jgi:hypothetical protein
MRVSLNSKQADGLANFFFDIGKGLVLSGIGSVIIVPEARLIAAFLSTLTAVFCVKLALNLLEEA